MHYRLKSLSLATATLLLSLFTPLLPLTLKFEPLAAQAQTTQDRKAEAQRLNQEGLQLVNKGQFREALEQFQKALVIVKEIGERLSEGQILDNIGDVYRNLEQYPKALEFYQQALVIAKETGDRKKQATILSDIADVYENLAEYPKALKFYLEYYEQALAIAKEKGDRKEEATILDDMGYVYHILGQYAEALEFRQQALAIHRKLGARAGEAATLRAIGADYDILGQYQKALEYYQSALEIAKEVGARWTEGRTLDGIGQVYYYHLKQPIKALEYYQQALKIRREVAIERGVGDRTWEAYILSNIAVALTDLGYYRQALETLQQSLTICREVDNRYLDNRRLESFILNGIGKGYFKLGDYPKAFQALQQSLLLSREAINRWTEIDTLSTIGALLEKQSQPELAIVFLKQSVNATEAIRRDLQILSKEQQQSYTETVAGTYRRLADLLLKQDRILEAQRVLDLLKVQELDDYLSNVRGNNNTAQGLPNLPPEQQAWENYQAVLDKAIEIGKELTQLRQIKPENRTTEQGQRIAQLVNVQQKIVEDFNNFIESPEVLALAQQLNPKARKADLVNNLDELIALQDNLKNLQQKAVLLYPLILDDRIELILTTPDSPPIRRTVSVTKKQLNETIVAFRSALLDRTSDAKPPAQQLYNWLIKPLEAQLKAADARTIIYAPDAQLRYIPLAALHDGQQWLVQRYRINNITAASLTELNTKPQRKMQVLAGAFATGRYSFKVGEQSFDFAGLPFAGVEVENLAKTVPTTTKFIDTAFTPQVTVPNMDDYSIVHLATHAAFVVGTPDDSFILFGNGERITLRDIQKWSLKNVDLVVLSACETGLGGKLGNGEEILGLGYQMQRAGARAAIASLWTVDDGGTQVLMDSFYAALESKGVGQDAQPTKAEALRQAQIALITGDYRALGQQRGLGVQQRIQSRLSPRVASNLSHPYYWAPFILIGNGL
ncbi:tetratricopeptide repeat protein [Microcoleus sp. ZQ-A2]|nr:tetratricopeptide repeat protein [Microcoleus sp. FACHB-1]